MEILGVNSKKAESKGAEAGLKSSFSDRFLKRVLFSLLFIGHYLKGRVVLTSKFLLSSKWGLFVLLFIFITFFSFFETGLNQQSLLAKAINYQKMSFSLNQNIHLISLNNQKEPSFHIASLAREDEAQEESGAFSLTTEGILMVPEKEIDLSQPLTRTETEIYNVQSGDTLYLIADKFGLAIDSLLWENNLTLRSIIKPGQALKILPVDGLTHQVRKGETLGAVAKKYKSTVDDIIEFNNLADASDIFVGDELILPHGRKPYVPSPPVVKPKKTAKSYAYSRPTGDNCHTFVRGQCTWYVASRRCIPWTGHAKTWLANARKMGFQTGNTPAKGAIISLRETGWAARRYGHVGYVESFNETAVTFSEMNFKGPWVKTIRTLDLNDPKIIGYIY